MAQVAIREYDAKKMFASYQNIPYTGYLIQSEEDMRNFLDSADANSRFVIKPDELFWKRGKYGLVWVNLSKSDIYIWWKEKISKEYTIGKVRWFLKTFLIEPFIEHKNEYFVSIKTEREADVLYFSETGGIDIEENWNSVQIIRIPVAPNKDNDDIFTPLSLSENREKILIFLKKIYQFFVEYGFASLEINPFTIDDMGNIICLDAVARLDDSEFFKQKKHWIDVPFPHPFWEEKTHGEKYIEKLDAETGASLKFRILNPHGRIWLLTSGGGASVIIADTLASLGFGSEIWNYGECSGNPDRENTREYTRVLLDALIASDSPWKKYLIIAGAIANFTHIDKTFSWIIDALLEKQEILRNIGLTILVRRGGINDILGLKRIQEACSDMGIAIQVADGNAYMTDILLQIHSLWNLR